MARGLTASQTIGPFFHHALIHDGLEVLVRPETRGERIVVTGRITDGDGAVVPDAMVEIWQANADGRYAHPEDRREDAPLDSAFTGWGRCRTDDDGRYRFETIMPGPVPGRGNTLQAPHIALTLFSRGLLNYLTTRIYFAGNPLNDTDPVLGAIEDEAARRTLFATCEEGGDMPVWRLDIRLQGDGETVFFDV
ncbi:MAG: protocatechuate 3,4-dioxygenase subunit alpha [Rhodospirillaceae bacterium]|nr:protocatechuate 3,4-dioxygenase subunit alpha [Rhodospirillaceae bacterium]